MGRRWGGLVMVVEVRVSASVPRGQRRPWPTCSYCGAPWPKRRDLAASRGKTGGLTVGVMGDRVVLQWRFEAV